MAVKVGSFAKSTGGAPASQSITGVGFKPWFVILWTAGNTSADTLSDGFHWGMGYAGRDASGTVTQGTVAAASEDNVADINSSTRISANVLAIVEWGESLLAEASLASFDNDGFSLSWTTNDANAYIVNYIAVGGASVTGAKVVAWTVPSSTGNHSVTGAGFTPHLVLHLGSAATSALPQTISSAYWIFGAMEDSGGQMMGHFLERDAYATGLGNTFMEIDGCMYKYQNNLLRDFEATYVSMDADGFTVNFSAAGASEHMLSLCVDGGSYDITSFGRAATVDAAPIDQSVTGVGFLPEGLLYMTHFANGTTFPGGVADTQMSIGATDGTTEKSAFVWSDYGTTTIDTKSYTDDDKAPVSYLADMSGVAFAADLKTFDADGMTLTWTTVANTNRAIGYIAFLAGAATATAKNWQHYAAQMGRAI